MYIFKGSEWKTLSNFIHNAEITLHYKTSLTKKREIVDFHYILALVNYQEQLTFLSFHFLPLAGGGVHGAVAEISVVEDQGHVVVAIFDVFFGGNSDAATFQGGKESGCDTIDEPHGHTIRFSATTDPGFATICWSETKEAIAAAWRGRSGFHGTFNWNGHGTHNQNKRRRF